MLWTMRKYQKPAAGEKRELAATLREIQHARIKKGPGSVAAFGLLAAWHWRRYDMNPSSE